MAIQEVLAELSRVRAEGLISDFALGGAVAAMAYIEVSPTEDVDVFVVLTAPQRSSLDPLSAVWPNLIAHGAKQDGIYLVIGDWKVQLLLSGKPLFDEAIATALQKELGGQVCRIIAPTYLAALALDAGRPKDYSRIEQFLKTGKVIRPELEALVERFGLTDRWNTFRSRYLGEQQ
jgi:hypothetical protein